MKMFSCENPSEQSGRGEDDQSKWHQYGLGPGNWHPGDDHSLLLDRHGEGSHANQQPGHEPWEFPRQPCRTNHCCFCPLQHSLLVQTVQWSREPVQESGSSSIYHFCQRCSNQREKNEIPRAREWIVQDCFLHPGHDSHPCAECFP